MHIQELSSTSLSDQHTSLLTVPVWSLLWKTVANRSFTPAEAPPNWANTLHHIRTHTHTRNCRWSSHGTTVCPKQQKVGSQLSQCISHQLQCQQFDLSHQTADWGLENGVVISSKLLSSPGTVKCGACQTFGLQLPQLLQKKLRL